jgi:acetate kinase
VDPVKNKVPSTDIIEIQNRQSPVKILVIPTNEELEISEQTVKMIQSSV